MTAKRLALFAGIGALLIGIGVWTFASNGPPDSESKAPLGLMTSLPIYWGESPELQGMLAEDQPAHWVRQRLEQDYVLIPLDTLSAADDIVPSAQLAELKILLLAQPSPLPPADLVALDTWVREGGRLLLFADPMLTEHSEFGLGDKRRPQDIAMLGPILARWGLQLNYEESQPSDLRFILFDAAELPIRKAGQLTALADGPSECAFSVEGIVAQCDIGAGKVLVVSDAALLEIEAEAQSGEAALEALIVRAFGSK